MPEHLYTSNIKWIIGTDPKGKMWFYHSDFKHLALKTALSKPGIIVWVIFSLKVTAKYAIYKISTTKLFTLSYS